MHFFALVSRLNAALSSATQHAMPPDFGRTWGTECLNTRFPLPTLLCAGYSVKLISFNFFICKFPVRPWNPNEEINCFLNTEADNHRDQPERTVLPPVPASTEPKTVSWCAQELQNMQVFKYVFKHLFMIIAA